MERVAAALKLVLIVGLLHVHHRFRGPTIDYLGLAAGAFGSFAAVPGPGEPVLIAEAIFAARHNLDITAVIVVAWLAATVGGMAGWLVGLRAGRALVRAPGPFRKARANAVEHGEQIFARHAVLAIYLTPSWVAGIHRVGTVVFLLTNVISAAIWAVLIGLGAYFAGPPIVDLISDMGTATLAALCVLVVVSVTAELLRRRRGHRRR